MKAKKKKTRWLKNGFNLHNNKNHLSNEAKNHTRFPLHYPLLLSGMRKIRIV